MTSRASLLIVGAWFIAAIVPAPKLYGGGCCYRQARDRGLAIMSPIDCPDPCDYPVGGCYRYTPYYPGYAPDRRCLVLYGTTSCLPGMSSAPGSMRQPADYGAFTGASRDEAGLLHLGGNGPGSKAPYRPYHAGSGDLLDRIHGR